MLLYKSEKDKLDGWILPRNEWLYTMMVKSTKLFSKYASGPRPGFLYEGQLSQSEPSM